ncbi:hypothetical protein NQ318_017369 [Aromia moschata]|uniref:Uncharacterized protein n=1 Tax=Aromia moschata TaxID=1265417 RepID=A0AAV8Z3J0_9CUCU|nr:hypothetical protein NQ318_017369 [Aromia moschata]
MSGAKERVMQWQNTGTYDTPFEISVFHWFVQRRTLVEPVSDVLLREGDFLFAEFCDNRNV